MSDYNMNNPMMDILKKMMGNPSDLMGMWTKNMNMTQGMDMMKNFNPASWMESMPWNAHKEGQNSMGPMSAAFNFADSAKHAETFANEHKVSLESAQAVLRRQAEIIQKHAEEVGKLMQQAISSRDPKEAMKRQSDYMRSTFDVLIADFKELVEMYSKASMESFDAASEKVKHHMDKAHSSCATSCSTDSSKEEKTTTTAKKSK
jgi:phasin family protein